MPEMRKDYLLDRWILYAPRRATRPHDHKKAKAPRVSKKDCHFCVGNEKYTPEEHARITKKGVWYMRAFENLYPAVNDDIFETQHVTNPRHSALFVKKDVIGKHEVIVETNDHDEALWDFSAKKISELLHFQSQRIEALETQKGVKFALVLKNHGPESGASIYHSHSQIVAYNQIPEMVAEKVKAAARYKKKHGKEVYSQIIAAEKRGPRVAFENEHAIAICPYAARTPFEVLILPKKHRTRLSTCTDKEIMALAQLLRKVLRKLKKKDASYNYYIHYAPKGKDLRVHIELVTRFNKQGGFEYGTEENINTVLPEDSARFYRR